MIPIRSTSEPENFIDVLLAEAEAAEDRQLDAYYDLVLVEIKRLNHEIANIFEVAEKEKSIIDGWALTRNTKLTERVSFLARKLQSFIEQRGVKTIDMPNGKLQIRKKPDRIEIEDLNVFLANADPSLLDSIPESCKPNLTKIKAHVKMTGGKVPDGCRLIPGDEAFSYKLKQESEDDGEDENGIGVEQSEDC